jgi:aspartate racemase
LEETAAYVKECGIKTVCLLATDGTLKGGYFHKAFEKHAITVTVPSKSAQADLMEIIYDIKRGEDVSADIFGSIIAEAQANGAEAAVLGCTELCVIAGKTGDKTAASNYTGNFSVINILEVLAEAAISFFRD